MDYQQLYNKYYSRMVKEGLLKSMIFALIVGLAVNGIVALVTWFVGFTAGLWIALAGLVVVTAAVTPILYSNIFRPTEKTVAKRLDGLGLEERIITMQELQNDTSVIASLQRADAVGKVEAAEVAAEQTGGKLTRFNMSTSSIVTVSCVGAFFVAATIVAMLFALGVIGSGRSLWNRTFHPNANMYSVTYRLYGESENNQSEAEVENSDINTLVAHVLAAAASNDEVRAKLTSGKGKQDVESGGSTGEVVYTAENYYYFVKWTDDFGNSYSYEDGYTPSRHDDNITSNIKFTAYFDKFAAPLDDGDLGRHFAESPKNGGGNGSGDPGNDDLELNKYDQIIDGNIKYTSNYDMYYDMAMEYLANNDDISSEERAMIESYFKILK